MNVKDTRRYFVAFIETLQLLLQYFPRYSIYVNDIRKMLRSIDEPNAPLPPQKASVEIDFRARPVSSEESSDENGNTSHIHIMATQPEAAIRHAPSQNIRPRPGTNLMMGGATDPSLQVPDFAEVENTQFPDLDMLHYGMDFAADPTQDLLWDWAGALGPNVNL